VNVGQVACHEEGDDGKENVQTKKVKECKRTHSRTTPIYEVLS